MKTLCLVAAILMAGVLSAAERPYTYSLKVENPKVESKTSDSGSGNGGNRRSTTKTTRRKMTWPVKVSFRGKEFPSSIKLQFLCIGTEDGTAAVLDKRTIEVKLDEKGDFKTDLVSPEATLTKTKRTGNSGRNGNNGGGSETKGTRITGCIIQLVSGDEVLRSFATKPTWAKLAKKFPLPEEDVLKIH